MATKAEVIINAVNENASDEELAVLEGTDEKEFESNANDCGEGLVWDEKLGICVPVEQPKEEVVNDDKKTDFLKTVLPEEIKPIVTFEEFSIFDVNEKGEDAETQVVKLLKSKGISASTSILGADAIEVTNAVGATLTIPLYTKDNAEGNLQYKVKNPETPYEDLMNFIDQPIDQKQADIYSKTKLMKDEEGSFGVEIQHAYGAPGEKISKYKASADEILQITDIIESETRKAFTSVSVDGIDINYPGLDGKYNSFNLQNVGEDTKEEVKKAVYEQVAKQFREENEGKQINLTYDDFLTICGGDQEGFFNQTLGELAIKQSQGNNIKALSEVDVNKKFIEEENKVIHGRLTPKEKEKVRLVAEVKKINKLLVIATEGGDADEMLSLTTQKNKLLSDIQENALWEKTQVTASLNVTSTVKDPLLASSFMTRNNMTDYRAENAAKGAQTVDLTFEALMNGILDQNPLMTADEALEKYYEAKTVRYQQLMKEGKEITVTLNRREIEKMGQLDESQKDKFYVLMEAMRQSTGKASLWNMKGYVENKIEISLSDLLNAGLDARDFEWHDLMSGILSDDDVNLLMQYELTRDENVGERTALYNLIYLDNNPKDFTREGGIVSFIDKGVETIQTSWFDQSVIEAQTLFAPGEKIMTPRALKII